MVKITFSFCFIFQLFWLTAHAQTKRIYIAPDDHTDYMWTAKEDVYAKAMTGMLDYYIRLNDSTANEPYPYQSKWNCDGSFWVYLYRENRSEKEFNRLIEQVRNGRITVPLNTLIGIQGISPTEATLRSMYFAGALERRYNLDLKFANTMEDHVLPLGLASLWAGSGAKYSWHGVCNCVTKVKGFDNRPHEIYWYKGLDNQKVLMKWYSLTKSMENKELGGYAEAYDPQKAILQCKELMDNNPKYPYKVAGAFGIGWDHLETLTDNFLAIAKKYSDDSCQVIISNETDFFTNFESQYGSTLPSETVSYGSSEWGINVASLANVSGSVKRSIEKLRAAEALSTLVSIKEPGFCNDLSTQKEKAWIACGMYFDHDWTADNDSVISRKVRAAWQRKTALQLGDYVDTVYNRSLLKLGKYITKGSKTAEEFYVFNSLGWKRTDYCDYPYFGTTSIQVIDQSTLKEVSHQIITLNNKSYLRILASEIPSVGYKTFRIVAKPSTLKAKQPVNISDNCIQNDIYKITLNANGAIVSLIDKAEDNKELVRSADGLYLNDLGGSVSGGNFRIENAGPVSATIVAEADLPVKHTVKITLFTGIKRIEIEDYITKNFGQDLSYAFSFNQSDPQVHHEEAGAILNASPVSKGGHYSEVISRLDWLAMNHFVDVSDGKGGVILSNRDAYFMKRGNSKVDFLDENSSQISVLAGGRIDADKNLGIPSQDGDSYLEDFFAIQSYAGEYEAARSMKFSLEHQNPLISGKIYGGKGYPAKQFSLVAISDPDVLLWALKPSEEGIKNGLIPRVWNLSDFDKTITISSSFRIDSCKRVTHIETNIENISPDSGKIIRNIGHNRMETYRLFLNE